MKLELKHLAPYLPYQLKIQDRHGDIRSMNPLDLNPRVIENGVAEYFSYIRPILRPMSDLNDSDLMKEWLKQHSIEKNIMGLQLETKGARCIGILGYPLQFINDLYREHFDVNGLILFGVAIDINTLNND